MWNVLYAAPNCEPQVCKFLGVHGIEGYAPQFPPPPRTKAGSVRDRRRRWVFPGYVFFKIADGFAQWDLIRWAPGVRRMLQSDGGPATVEDGFVDHLRRRIAEQSLKPSRPRFQKGQSVVIQSGPLRMVDAIFEKNLDASARVQVLVQLLGRPLTVEVDAAIVRAAG
jgi:transcription antitermination factor NusG